MGLTTKGRDQKADARDAYMLAFNTFATDPSEVAQTLKVGVRYARELLALGVELGVLTEQDVNGEGLVWQTVETYDSVTREQAEAIFDEAWNTRVAPSEDLDTEPVTKVGNKRKCLCGCDAYTNHSASTYLPGHDARHAGRVARALATASGATEESALLGQLPSAKLRAKAEVHATRLRAKAQSATPAPVTEGSVKVGRHELRAQRNDRTGEVLYLRGKDSQWVLAVARIAKSFVAGHPTD